MIWQTLLDDFVELMEVDIEPYRYTAFHHTTSGLDILLLPDTTIHGAYSIAFDGIPAVNIELNPMMQFQTNVRMRVGFVINSEAVADPNSGSTTPVNDKTDYSHAVEDLFLIIKTRLQPATYEGVLDFVSFVSCSGLTFLNGTENYAYADITFTVGKWVTP